MRNIRSALSGAAASLAFCTVTLALTPMSSLTPQAAEQTTQAPAVKAPAKSKARTSAFLAKGKPASAAAVQHAKTDTTTIIAGNPNSTYLAIAYDIATTVEEANSAHRVMPILGKGSYQNIADLLHQKRIDVGLTHTNVLAHLKRTGELGKDIDRQIAYIAKLYNEEVHVLASGGIDSLQDLAGKRVHLGAKGSGSDFTGRQLLRMFNITATLINGCETESFQQLKSGTADAIVLVAGKPAAALSRHANNPDLKLLPIPYPQQLQGDFLPAKFNHAAYPNLVPEGHTVDTVAVGAVLAVYNWPRKNPNYQRLDRFITGLFNNFSELKSDPHHPKWRETNLAAPLPGWTRYGPAKKWVDRVGKAIRQSAKNQTKKKQAQISANSRPAKRPPN